MPQIDLTETEIRFGLLNIGASVEFAGPILSQELEDVMQESAQLIPDPDDEEEIKVMFPGLNVNDLKERALFQEKHTASMMRKLAAALKEQA